MNIQDYWEKALRFTEIIRPRIQPLQTFAETVIPYIFLAESVVNPSDTAVRKGEVLVERPSIILPSYSPQLEGFEFDQFSTLEQDMVMSFFLVRGIRFPSLKYHNRTETLDVFEGRLQAAIDLYSRQLQRDENTATGLLIGPEDCWQFSVLIFVASQISSSRDGDIRKLLDDFKKKNR